MMDSYFLKDTLDDLQSWLVQLTYWYGWTRGLRVGLKEHDSSRISLYDSLLQPEELEYRWYRHHGRIYLTIYEKNSRLPLDQAGLSSIMLGGKNLVDHLVFGYDTVGRVPAEMRTEIVDQIEQRIRWFFPEINAYNSYRFCCTPVHLLAIDRKSSHITSEPVWGMCKQIGKQWLCTECIERFDFDSEQPMQPQDLNKKQQAELSKLKPDLRLSILQRDQFTCAVCQRSILNGDDVRLVVDYRIPVKDGGKIVADNLATICRDCWAKQTV